MRVVARASGRLPAPVQDAALAAVGSDRALLVGGLDQGETSVTDIVRLSATEAVRAGSLPTALHDASASAVGGQAYLFGGGVVTSFAGITRISSTGEARAAGQLPSPASDLATAVIAGTVYVVGGYTGQAPLQRILAWRPGGAPPRVVGMLPKPLRYAAVAAQAGQLVIAGGTSGAAASRDVYRFDPRSGQVTTFARLAHPLTHAAAAALHGTVFVLGGRDASANGQTRRILAISPSGAVSTAGVLPQPLSDLSAVTLGEHIVIAGGRDPAGHVHDAILTMSVQPSPSDRVGRSRVSGGASEGVSARAGGRSSSADLSAGSDPGVLPGPVLIADRDNNRLLEVSPTGKVLWRFPQAGDLAPGQSFRLPDDAFFSPSGHEVVVTQEDDFVISVVDYAHRKIVFRYGHPGVPGSEPGFLHNPDDALLTPGGAILSADIKNCRVVVIRPPAQHVTHQLGETGNCAHELGVSYGSPNGAFPMSNGDTVVTEINGDWIDVLAQNGRPLLDTHPPGFSYPSDTNEVRPGVFLSADYTRPGAIETFSPAGALLWRYEPTGAGALDQPSLALPLPNGDVLANDDKNDRVIVVDPHTNRIVWQYGHTHQPGSRPGYLANPDGVDLAPPNSLAARFATTLHAP